MASQDSAVADLLVLFGISGDLPRAMTYRTLYRPEQRPLRWQQRWLSADS
jgi:glucose-6-phosphate 1-dehydrogenase